MSKVKIEVEVKASTDAEAAEIRKALEVLGCNLTAKELTRLRQIVQFEPSLLATARRALKL
jgi:hypothetical protein